MLSTANGASLTRGVSSTGTSLNSPNTFTVLDTRSDDDLDAIARDCNVILGKGDSEITSTLNAMRLEELARAALAESSYKAHLEEKLAGTHFLEGENLELGCISNSHRGFAVKKSGGAKFKKGGGQVK